MPPVVPQAPIPVDPARVPTLTEVVEIALDQSEPASETRASVPPKPSVAGSAAHEPSGAGAARGAQVLPAGSGSATAAPMAAQQGTPPSDRVPALGVGAAGPRSSSLPPWAYKVVAEAVDEAIAQAMPQLMSDITSHVQRRLLEASKSHPDRLI